MYAVITAWTLADARVLAQYREVRAQLIPPVEQLPGFIAGYTYARSEWRHRIRIRCVR